MYQTIGENIAVAGVYARNHFKPVKFQWRERDYRIDEITMVSELRNGGVRQRLYSVVVGRNVYRLLFDRDQEQWQVSEVWFEG